MILGHEFMEEVSAEKLARWRSELNQIAPRSTRLTWLDIFWHAGFEKKVSKRLEKPKYEWVPVNRWVIYQLTDNPENVPTPFLSTRLARLRLIDDTLVTGALELEDKSLDRNQRRIFRETGCLATPYWIIQGSLGGHKRRYDEVEARVARLHKAPTQPPAYCDLPYAEPDERTWNKIRQMDKLAAWKQCLDFADRNPDQLDQEEEAEAVKYREQVWAWMGERSYEAVSGNRNQWREMLTPYSKPKEKDTTNYEALHKDFIETAA